MRIRLLLSLTLIHAAGFADPLTPEQSMATMEIDPAFTIGLFSAEPDIIDPVDMTFDEFGRAYVCEMREMEDLPALEPGTLATIRMLEDTDHDGRADKSTIFADGLSFPGGIAPWKGGIFALCTPDLLYLKDTDGDGKADQREVVLTGFAQGNAEHRFNNLTWSVDNGIYAANGHGGGKVFDPSITDAEPVDLKNYDMRLDPWNRTFERESRQIGGGFGLTFDDWNRRFVDQNEMHIIHVVLPFRYLGRNPNLALRAASEDISDHGKPDAPVYPISAAQDWRIERTRQRAETMSDRFRPTQLNVNGYFTAACGVTVYRADLFPESYRGNLFVCDAAQNLIHRDALSEAGATIVASRAADGETEFLRSSDQWFRPVNLEVGPDGAIYVLDFNREIIETAASIPPDILEKIDIQAGNNRGRIYRIAPKNEKAIQSRPMPGMLDNDQLVDLLGDPNAWWRQTAQRLLIERDARDQIEKVQAMAKDSTDPLARLHAAWTLEGLAAVDDDLLVALLSDDHPRLREQALVLAERRLD